MTDYTTGEAANSRDELMAALHYGVSAAFVNGELDGFPPNDAVGPDATPVSLFSWPSTGLARSVDRAASTGTFLPDTDGSLSWETSQDVVSKGDDFQDKLSLHELAWDEALRAYFVLRHSDVTPDGTVDHTNTTDRDGLRSQLQLVGEIRR